MAVKIGSARSSYGDTSPGDQNKGLEVSTQDWYKHSKGWVLLRAKDPEARERIATAMQRACDNNDIGYSQPTRLTLYNNVKDKGFDPALTTKKVNTDCSALVRVCCAYAGIKVDDFITSNEASTLMASGKFEKLTDDKYTTQSSYLKRGDILVTKTKGHTVVVLTDGVNAEPDAPASEVDDGKNMVVCTGNSVYIRTGPCTKYTAMHVAHKGDTFEVPDTEGWIPIIYGGHVYWMSSKYLTNK